MILPPSFHQCRIKGCLTAAASGPLGLCPEHRRQRTNRTTSDGVHTGSRPKLTPEQVAEARRLWAAFYPLGEIARKFGVHRETMRKYLRSSAGGAS